MSRHYYPPHYNEDREYENKVNEIRVEKGLTLREVGEAIGVHPSAMWNISQGYTGPNYERGNNAGKAKPWAELLEIVLGYELTEIFPREFCDLQKINPLVECQILAIAHSYGNRKSIDDAYRNIEKMAIVDEAMDKCLDERARAIMILHFLKEVPVREIITIYKVSKSRIHQIIMKSCRLIRQYCYRQHKLERKGDCVL